MVLQLECVDCPGFLCVLLPDKLGPPRPGGMPPPGPACASESRGGVPGPAPPEAGGP